MIVRNGRSSAMASLLFLYLLIAPSCAVVRKLEPCQQECSLELVETIPIGLAFPQESLHPSTADAWLDLIESANTSLDIGSYYWTLQASDVVPDPSSASGEAVFRALKKKAGLLRIVLNSVTGSDPDTEVLVQAGAKVRQLNMTALIGAGILHTKFIIADAAHFYIGSANMDWRSLAQVKELGIVGRNCPCLAQDLGKVFSVYWAMANTHNLPDTWPKELATDINMDTPAQIVSNGIPTAAFISSSPPQFSPFGRTQDIDAVLNTIRQAQGFVHIAVMDYFPAFIYSPSVKFWPFIDDELRRAYVSRGIKVKLLVSKWPHTRTELMLPFLKSLVMLNGIHDFGSIEVKWFEVPTNSTYDHIPFSRVNHNKYMVTDTTALIGTSNWSADYFTDTCGVSMVISASHNDTKSILRQVNDVFLRDWHSEYTVSIEG